MKEFKIGITFLTVIGVLYFTIVNSSVTDISEPLNLIYKVEDKEVKYIVDKFFRDLNNHGLNPVISEKFIIELKSLDSYKTTSHVHGISLGKDDENLVEIYINSNSWDSFNKTQKYYIIYHELSHDVLNLNDLSDNKSNFGKIMYPNMSVYNDLDMNDFIENMNELFSSLNL